MSKNIVLNNEVKCLLPVQENINFIITSTLFSSLQFDSKVNLKFLVTC